MDKAQLGDSCFGWTTCTRADSCCTDTLECSSAQITAQKHDCSACPTCADDQTCAIGQWCLLAHCEPCPTLCPVDCPSPFVHLNRHGCQTCDCGPATSAVCKGAEKSLPGAYCQAGCSGPGCCVELCTAPGCANPDPEGCSIACGNVTCGSLCRAEACQCVGGSWSCQARCAGEKLEPYVNRCKAIVP